MHRLHSVTATQFCVHPKTPVASLSRSLSLEDRPTFPRLRTSIVECALPWDWSTGLPGNIVLPVPSPWETSRWPDGGPMLSWLGRNLRVDGLRFVCFEGNIREGSGLYRLLCVQDGMGSSGSGLSLGGRMRPSMHKALDFIPRDTPTVSDGTSL